MQKYQILGTVVLLVLGIGLAHGEPVVLVMPHHGVEIRDTATPGAEKSATFSEDHTANGLTFHIEYYDLSGVGFLANGSAGTMRRDRLAEALTHIAETINMPGELDVRVNDSELDGSGALAYAGTYFALAAGFQDGSSLRRLLEGSKPFANTPEIELTVDFGWDWNSSLADPGLDEVDLLSVLIHEFTHGLGFATLVQANGESVIRTDPGSQDAHVYTVFDSLILHGPTATYILDGAPPVLQGGPGLLVSEALQFGTNANEAYTAYGQGVAPPLFAPSTFIPGSSLSHWDSGHIVGGAVMEHQFIAGTQRRSYSALDVGALRDLGFDSAVPVGGEGEGEGEGEPYCGLLSFEVTGPADTVELPTGATSGEVTLQSQAVLESVGCATSAVEVSYVVDGGPMGSSMDLGNDFPLTIIVSAGPHTVSATATVIASGEVLTDVAAFTVVAGTPYCTLSGVQLLTPGEEVEAPAGATEVSVTMTAAPDWNGNGCVEPEIAMAYEVDGAPAGVSSEMGNSYARTATLGVGPHTISVTATANETGDTAYDTRTVTVTEAGAAPALSVTPGAGPLAFGGLAPGELAERTVTVRNSGGGTLSGTAQITGSSAFSLPGAWSWTLNGGQSAEITVRFSPAAEGDYAATLVLSGDPGGNISIALSGTGLKTGFLGCAPSGGPGGRRAGDVLAVALMAAALALSTARRKARVSAQ